MSPPHPTKALPHGTVTFLFTDIEGSTELLQSLGERFAELLADQRKILRAVFSRRNGQEVDTQGDSFFYAFLSAREAVAAAAEAQRALSTHPWPGEVQVRLRMGIHTGEPLDVTEEGYIGMDVHRAARIAHAGHGGQVLLSETTSPLVADDLPPGATLLDLGRHRLKDMRRPEHIAQLSLEGLGDSFPSLKSMEVLPPLIAYDYGPLRLPTYLDKGKVLPSPTFVARLKELDKLQGFYESALSGYGQMAFVVGGPGRGKSALLQAFCRQVGGLYPDTLIGWGECSAYTGLGDPYLPFRYLFRALTGDVENLLASGKLGRKAAIELWQSMPETAQVITETGPDLLGVLLSGRELLARVHAATPRSTAWIEHLAALAQDRQGTAEVTERRLLFEQVEDVLTELALQHPLVLVLDDMQWADSASIDLLFHISRRLAGRRILLLIAYRPEEVMIGRGDGIHPLRHSLTEFKRLYGEVWIDLSQTDEADSRMFIEEYLDSEPNALKNSFREALSKRTGGHALFTVELVRALQERGNLVKDEQGKWVDTAGLDWDQLPARVEGVIEERYKRLPADLKEILQVASIEGEVFTAQAVGLLLGLDERRLFQALGQQLAREHRLVREQGLREFSKGRLSFFTFQHAMIQEYVYRSMGAAERSSLHARVGLVLEELHAGEEMEIAGILAHHFSLGVISEKAVTYLLHAGDRARAIHAYQEAIEDYQKALGFLEKQGTPEPMARTLLKLGLIFNAQGRHTEANQIYDQAFELWEPLRSAWESESAERITETLRLALDIPEQLDPGLISDDVSTFIAQQLFEGLVTIDAENNVLPAAAARWEILDDGRRYRFHLRRGLLWSDGSPLTAEDFVRTWCRNLKLSRHSPNAQHLFVIKNARAFAEGSLADERDMGLTALDELTLEITLETPIAYLPHLLTLPIAFPLPPELTSMDETFDIAKSLPVLNGPYRIEEYARDDRLILQRNPHYRGFFPGNIQRVEGYPLGDYPAAFDKFEQGELDMLSMITSDPKTVRQARRRFGEQLKFIPHPTTFFVTFCCERPPFDSAVVRQAFVHAVDREELVAQTSQGQYLPALGGFLPPGMPGHKPDVGLAYDLERARALLSSAGFPGGNDFPQVEFLFTGPDPHDPLIDYLCVAWDRELGIRVNAENTTWEAFVQRRDQDPPHLSIMGFTADYPDPDAMLRYLFHSQRGFLPLKCGATNFDQLVDRASVILDPEKRIELYQAADNILVKSKAAVMPIGYGRGRLLYRPGIAVPEFPLSQLRLKEVLFEVSDF